jgi:hypothetical protein
VALDVAFELRDGDTLERLLGRIESVPPGTRPPLLDGHARRLRARSDGDPDGFAAAVDVYRRIDTPFFVAVALLELGELTGDAAPLAEAREIFARLRATPWLARLAAAGGPAPVPAAD